MTTTLDAEKAKAVFEQNFSQYRMLNEQLNRIPAFAVTLTGGFWYIAVVIQSYGPLSDALESLARCLLMTFAGICNVMLVFIAIRVRNVMQDYEIPLKAYAGASWPQTTGGRLLGEYSMIGMYCTLILGAALLSFLAAAVLFWPDAGQPWYVGLLGLIAVLLVLLVGCIYLPRLGRK